MCVERRIEGAGWIVVLPHIQGAVLHLPGREWARVKVRVRVRVKGEDEGEGEG